MFHTKKLFKTFNAPRFPKLSKLQISKSTNAIVHRSFVTRVCFFLLRFYASAYIPPKKKKKRKKNLLSRRKTKREKRIIPSEETINVTFTSREPIKILLSQYDAFPFLFSLRRWDHDPITRALKWPMDHPVHARINDGGHSPPLFSLKISFECASTPWRVIFWPERLRSCSERSIKPVNSRGWLTGHRGIVKGCFCAGTNELKMTSLFASRVKTTGGDRVSRNEHEMPVYFEVP